jgi:glycosyltransferase involved in cell wall biosynthesis
MRESDACFVSIRGSRKSYCIPSKIFQYISTGSPVLAFGPEGEMGEFIEQQGIGLFADCSDRKARVLALSRMAGDRKLLSGMREAATNAAARFSLEAQAENLDLFLRALPAGEDRRPES